MDDIHERLKWARARAGFANASQAAARLGVPYGTYSGHENSGRGVKREDILRYAKAYKVSPGWLAYGEGRPFDGFEVPIVGYVGAGAEEHHYSDSQRGAEKVEAPQGCTPETVAVEVRGDSLGPFFENALLFYDERQDPPSSRLIGEVCVCGLADGRVLVKQLRRGSTPGRWTLHSQFGSPIEDVEILWAAPVRAIIPRPRTVDAG